MSSNRPNVVLVLCDDMGFSDIGCFGGEIETPVLDNLAAAGVRFTQFYSSPRCCPSRASLLTGLYSHQAGIGLMTENIGQDGYLGDLSPRSVTIAEVLGVAGYRTYMSGKWHVTRFMHGPKHNWPCQRGFNRYYGLITGASSYFHPYTLTRDNESIEPEEGYYVTDAIADNAAQFVRDHAKRDPVDPFFLYVAFTAPHWPLHAPPEAIAKYRGRYAAGWDALREARLDRQRKMGLISPEWRLSDRAPSQPAWQEAENKEWEQRRMEVYAAQVERMDSGVGTVVESLKETGQYENTLILFLSDNGGCAEVLTPELRQVLLRCEVATANTHAGQPVVFGNDPARDPGDEDTYQSYGVAWANLSNSPFRMYKHWVHEGGIASPFIAHWPNGITDRGGIRHDPAQLPDIMATAIELAGATYPKTRNGLEVKPLEGYSLAHVFDGATHARPACYWEHEGNRGVRKGKWKLVRKYPGDWELFDMDSDRTELDNLATEYPDIVAKLDRLYFSWAARCDVREWDEVRAIVEANKTDASPSQWNELPQTSAKQAQP